MTTTKKFNKIFLFFATLIAVLLLLLPLAGCGAEDNMYGKYEPTDLTTTNVGSYIEVNKDKTARLVRVPFSVPSDSDYSPYKDFSVVDAVVPFTYSTTEVKLDDKDELKKYGDSYYPVKMTVNGYTINAYYFYKNEDDVKIVYTRYYPNTDIPYYVVYKKVKASGT